MSALIPFLFVTAPSWAAWDPTGAAVDSYNKAVVALAEKDPERALRLAERARVEDAACDRCLMLVGVARSRLDQADQAYALLAPLALAHPDQPELLLAVSQAAFASQAFPEARTYALAALAADVNPVDGYSVLLTALLRLGELDEAAKALDGASSTVEAGILGCLRADLAIERRDLDAARAYTDSCSEPRRKAVLLGTLEAKGGDLDSAADHLEGMNEGNISDHMRALHAFNQGDLDRAESLLNRSMRGGERNAQVWAIRGLVRHERGDLQGALEDLTQAISQPEYVQMHRAGTVSGVLTKSQEQAYRSVLREAALLRMLLLVRELSDVDARALAIETGRLLGEPAMRELCEGAIDMARGRPAEAWERVVRVAPELGEDRALAMFRSELVEAFPDDVPQEALASLNESQRTWLARHAEVAAHNAEVAAHNEVVDAFNEALAAAAKSRCADALRSLDRVAGRLLPGMEQTALQLRYNCALVDKDLAMADALLAEHGLDTLPVLLVFNHGVLRQDEGDPEGGRALSVQACDRATGTDRKQCDRLLGR